MEFAFETSSLKICLLIKATTIAAWQMESTAPVNKKQAVNKSAAQQSPLPLFPPHYTFLTFYETWLTTLGVLCAHFLWGFPKLHIQGRASGFSAGSPRAECSKHGTQQAMGPCLCPLGALIASSIFTVYLEGPKTSSPCLWGLHLHLMGQCSLYCSSLNRSSVWMWKEPR